MLDPRYLQHIAEGAEEISSELHSYIIHRIVDRMMIRIGRGEEYLFTSADRWQIEIMQDSGALLEDIIPEIAKYTKREQKEIKAAMEEAGIKAVEQDDKIYEAAGLSPMPLLESPQLIRLMQRNYDATLGEWDNYTRTTADAAQRLFINSCDTAYHKVTSGAVSYTQAVREAVDEVVSGGVYVNYTDEETGRVHKDTIETATARAVRTGIGQATGDIVLKRMEEMGWDTILVSAHLGARTGDGGQNPGNHLWWQGQFYSRTGQDKQFPPFYASTGYGTGEGLCGWNCRHSFGSGDGVNNPYKDIQTADNEKIEKLEQHQRALERRIRKTKRIVAGMQTAVEACQDPQAKAELQMQLDKKSFLLQRQNKAYNDFCKANELRPLADRLRIARWGREQAAKARGAARRYQNAKGN
ncbi:Phage minor capsid protein 2 [uncultured Clostridium sp.]|nr:Phage minor capsid protein 2 [uncultured Clostridium sp.]